MCLSGDHSDNRGVCSLLLVHVKKNKEATSQVIPVRLHGQPTYCMFGAPTIRNISHGVQPHAWRTSLHPRNSHPRATIAFTLGNRILLPMHAHSFGRTKNCSCATFAMNRRSCCTQCMTAIMGLLSLMCFMCFPEFIS